jgi:hypothetical protein
MNETDNLAGRLQLACVENEKLRKSLALLHAYSLKIHEQRSRLLTRERELLDRIDCAFEDGFEAGVVQRVGSHAHDSTVDERRRLGAVRDANATASAK